MHFEAARTREVFDVSGPGTCDRGAGPGGAAGDSAAQAMRLANTAAGIAVSKLGTATVELDEPMLELSRDVRDKEWHREESLHLAEADGPRAALEEPRS